jgi:hypothetical protein
MLKIVKPLMTKGLICARQVLIEQRRMAGCIISSMCCGTSRIGWKTSRIGW